MFNPSALAEQIFGVLRSFDYTVNIFDFNGNRVYEPDKARRFFASPRNITVSIFDDGENSSIKMFLSQSTAVAEIAGLIETMRTTASKFGVLFNVRKYQRELVPKDLAPNSNMEHEKGSAIKNAPESTDLDAIKTDLGDLRKAFPKVIADLKAEKAKQTEHKAKVKENMNEDTTTLEEKKGPPMMNLPALGCDVEIDAWNAFKDGSLELYSPPEAFSDDQLPNHRATLVIKLKAIADKTRADGMANMFSRVADALEHGADDKLLIKIADRAIDLAYNPKLDEEILVEKHGPEMINLPAIGYDVEKDAWSAFKDGCLDMAKPVSFDFKLGGSVNPQAFYLRQISDVVAADGMANMFARVADDIDSGDRNKLKLHIANVAIAIAKAGGKTNLHENQIIVTESIRAFGNWFDSLSSDHLFETLGRYEPHEEAIEGFMRQDDMDAAFDIACKYVDDNFDIGDFLDEQDTLTIDDDTFTEDDKITTRTELMGALRSYLKHAIDNEMDGAEYTTDHDVAMMVDEYYPQAEQALKDMGWAIDGEKVEESEQTEKRRFLQFVNSKTGERAESPGKVEVTGKSERDIERIESGMLRNCGSDWYVDDFCDDALDEDTELSNEDVLLPKNEKTDLTREVTNTHEDEPDQDVNRILSLARGKNL